MAGRSYPYNKVTIYRKPKHTDQYLNFDSNHHLEHKRSVVRTLMDRVDKLVTTDEDKQQETSHFKTALKANGYKSWMFKTPKPKKKKDRKETTGQYERKINVPLPYIKGLSEKLSYIFRGPGVNAYHKPVNTIRFFLVHPKDKTPNTNKCGVIYRISCPECENTYVGETSRNLGTRFKEHTRTTTPEQQSVTTKLITNTTSAWTMWKSSAGRIASGTEKSGKP
ncbi:uncharacterized protein [Amphiura filiformis]|uniref:uncharacterized protein n=1 Tax=Amphiura filiformis TaxID=82378 RepID=UPI003B2272EF